MTSLLFLYHHKPKRQTGHRSAASSQRRNDRRPGPLKWRIASSLRRPETRQEHSGRQPQRFEPSPRHAVATMILLAYRHGLRASEPADLRCGIRSISIPRPLPLGGPRRARLLRIRSGVMNCEHCAGRRVSKSPAQHSCSPPNVAHRSRQQALRGWWSALARQRGWASKRIRHILRHACRFALANQDHDARALQATWVTRTFSTQCGMRSWRRVGLRTSGGSKERTLRLAQCKVPSSSSSVIACARHCSLSCWVSRSISSRIRWQTSLASRRRSTSRALGCFLNNTTDPRLLLDPDVAQLGGGLQP